MNFVGFALPVISFVLIPLSGYAQAASVGTLRPALWCGMASSPRLPPRKVRDWKPRRQRRPIRQLLDTQAAAWNRGDLEGYMSGYWNSRELTFFSGATETAGWKPTLERYRQHYKKPGARWAISTSATYASKR